MWIIDRADPPYHAHMAFRLSHPAHVLSHPARNYNHKDPKKRVIHLHYADPADRTDPSDHADPPTQSYSSVKYGTCMFDLHIYMCSSFMQIVLTPPSRGVQITKDHLYRRYRSHPGDKYLNGANPVNFGATLSFKQYSSPCLLPGMRQDMREHRRLDHYSSLLAIDQ